LTKVRFIGLLPPPIGGVTIHTYRLFKWLRKSENIYVKITSLNKVTDDDENIEFIGNKITWMIKRLLFGFKEDIIHYHGSNFFGLIFLYIIKKIHSNFKLVWSIQGEHIVPLIVDKPKIFKNIIFNLDKIIVANDNIKKDLLSLGIVEQSIEQLSPFLMPLETKKIDLLNKYKLGNNKILIFNAYRLELRDNVYDIYGFKTLINAFRKIDINTVLILLIPQMNQHEKNYFEEQLITLDKSYRDRVYHIADEENEGWQYISQSDIFIRPTITDGDALSIREALCNKVPAIVSDCVSRPKESIIFKTNDSDDLAIKINNLLENYEERKNKLNNIEFCNSSYGNEYISLYTKIGKKE